MQSKISLFIKMDLFENKFTNNIAKINGGALQYSKLKNFTVDNLTTFF